MGKKIFFQNFSFFSLDCEKGHSYSEKISLKPKKVVFIQNYSIFCVFEMGPVTLELIKMWVKITDNSS